MPWFGRGGRAASTAEFYSAKEDCVKRDPPSIAAPLLEVRVWVRVPPVFADLEVEVGSC